MRKQVRPRNFNRRKKTYRQPAIYNRTSDMEGKQRKVNLGLISFLCLLFGLVYLVFFSPVFMVKEVEIGETVYIDREIVLTRSQEFIKSFFNRNIVTINTSKLAEKIQYSPSIKNIKIIRRLPNKIAIEIEERGPIFILEHPKGRFLIDENGYAFLLEDEKYSNVPLIKDNRGLEIENGSKSFNSNLINLINIINIDFLRLAEVEVRSIELINTIDEMKVITDAGWYAYFNPEYNAESQLVNLSRIIQDAKNKGVKLEYVDLRAENKIFYK